jgi:hypothetical protein
MDAIELAMIARETTRLCPTAVDRNSSDRGVEQHRIQAHLDEGVGLGQVVTAGGLVVEVALVRLRQPVAAAEDVAAAALEARQPDLDTRGGEV